METWQWKCITYIFPYLLPRKLNLLKWCWGNAVLNWKFQFHHQSTGKRAQIKFVRYAQLHHTIAFQHTHTAIHVRILLKQYATRRVRWYHTARSNSHLLVWAHNNFGNIRAAGIIPEISAAVASWVSRTYAVRNTNLCFINKPTDKVKRKVQRENAPSSAASNSRVFAFKSAPGLIRCTQDPSCTANPTETFTLNRAVSRATTSTSVQQIGFKAYTIIKQASCCIQLACGLVVFPLDLSPRLSKYRAV